MTLVWIWKCIICDARCFCFRNVILFICAPALQNFTNNGIHLADRIFYEKKIVRVFICTNGWLPNNMIMIGNSLWFISIILQGQYPGSGGGYPSQQGAYPQAGGFPPQPQQGGYPPQGGYQQPPQGYPGGYGGGGGYQPTGMHHMIITQHERRHCIYLYCK